MACRLLPCCVLEGRRQLRQEQDKLRRLSKSHARLKETAREATARAQAAEALVTTARDVQRRAEKAMAKLDMVALRPPSTRAASSRWRDDRQIDYKLATAAVYDSFTHH